MVAIGDKIKCSGYDGYTGEGVVVEIDYQGVTGQIYIKRADSGAYWRIPKEYYKVVTSKSNMNILSMFRNLNRKEPEKTFVKAGVMDERGDFTEEGYKLFKLFLVEKFGEEFKTEVVDKILAAQDEKEVA